MGQSDRNAGITGNDAEVKGIQAVARSDNDHPVLMLNLNRYSAAAGFPDGSLYNEYMAVLSAFLPAVGGKVLWRHPVFGQAVGDQQIDEVLAAWYPSHQAFLDLTSAPGATENFRLRALAVDYAVIHRMPGDVDPLRPAGAG